MPEPRPLHAIAAEIRRDWRRPYFGAEPYLKAMAHLERTTDTYGADTGAGIVRYFLANAGTWRGDAARRVKAELRELLDRPAELSPGTRKTEHGQTLEWTGTAWRHVTRAELDREAWRR